MQDVQHWRVENNGTGETVSIYAGERLVADVYDDRDALRIVAAREREAALAATVEAQRDVEIAMMQAARPYSALHSYHQGREEAFSSVLEALSRAASGREAGR